MSQWKIEPTPYSGMVLAVILAGLATIGIGVPTVGLVLFGLAGALISFHLYDDKRDEMESHVCPVGEDCVKVITSKYSKFMGISVEVLGLLYYMVILLGYLLVLSPIATPMWFTYILVGASGLAVLFSIYLTYIQAVPLRMWCIWCVTSAILSTLILLTTIGRLGGETITILAQFTAVSRAAYLIIVAAGFGIALATDLLTLRFLGDYDISEKEAGTLKFLFDITWAAFGLLALAGIFWFVPSVASGSAGAEIMASAVVYLVLVINGTVFYFRISDRLVDIKFPDRQERGGPMTRRLAFALSPVSIVSWAGLLLMAVMDVGLAFRSLLAVYIAAVGIAILVGLFLERAIEAKAAGRFETIFAS